MESRFTDYVLEPNLVNEHSHWTSADGKKAIWYSDFGDWSYWLIGNSEDRGTTIVSMYGRTEDECVQTKDGDVGQISWTFWNYPENKWELAAEGAAFVECFTGMYFLT